jgi:pimeloyl-ACP methyl ester carboxylesterase
VQTRVGEIAYAERGEGPAALFVHGVFVNSHLWRHVIDRLCGERRCIALDLLSHGDSPAAPGQDISFRARGKKGRARASPSSWRWKAPSCSSPRERPDALAEALRERWRTASQDEDAHAA